MGSLIRVGDRRLVGRVAEVLRSGGVVILPCDTMYGIVGIVPDAEGRIRSIKGRGEDKPFIQLIASPRWLARLADARPPRGLLELWPGPLTLILPARGGGTVGVRLPDDRLLLRLMRRVGKPLYSTSVNVAGRPALSAIGEILASFRNLVDLVVDAGDRPASAPSTIVDLTRRPYHVVRQGELRVPPALLEA